MNSIKNNRLILIIIIMLISYQLFIPQGLCTSIETINISIPGEQPRTIQESPVMVAGIWHFINLTLTDTLPNKLTLALYNGNNPPPVPNRNENTYYEWEYDAGNWQESTAYGDGKYSYINTTQCNKNDNIYSFYIGIKSDIILSINTGEIDTESWTLEINADETVIKKDEILIEEPVIGFAQQSAEFYLQCEPFLTTVLQPEHSFGVINRFNVPFRIQLDYTQFSENIQTTNTNTIVHPNSTSTHEIIINIPQWPPGTVSIEGIISATPRYIVQTGDVYLRSTPTQNFPYIKIYVGHENYKIFESTDEDIVFQYEEELDIAYNDMRNITAYISGNGNLSIKRIYCENSILLNTFYQNSPIMTYPFTIRSTNTSEIYINSRVHFNQADTLAFLNYELEIAGKTYTFQTKINVGETTEPSQETNDTTIPLIFVGLCIIIVIGYIIYRQMKSRRN